MNLGYFMVHVMKDRYGGEKYIKDSAAVIAQSFSLQELKETGYFFIGHFTIGYKRKLILKYPYNDPEICVGDWGMLYNMIIRGKVKTGYTKKILCAYRVIANSLNQQQNPEYSNYAYNKKMRRLIELGDLCN